MSISEMSTELWMKEGGDIPYNEAYGSAEYEIEEYEEEIIEEVDDQEYEEEIIEEVDNQEYEEDPDHGEEDADHGEDEESGDDANEKELDDDEDKRNPQYIPKKGYFYEHDDRTNEDQDQICEVQEEEEVEERQPKKSTEKKDKERWCHDKYDAQEQAPKSSDELHRTYGYNIREDDVAPRARRRRRYGRGPNKYTRKWEEEEAYHKSRGGFRGRGGGGRGRGRGGRRGRNISPLGAGTRRRSYDEDFPALAEKKNIDPVKAEGDQKQHVQEVSEVSEAGPKSRYKEYKQGKGIPRGRGTDRGGRHGNEYANRGRYQAPGKQQEGNQRRPSDRENRNPTGKSESNQRAVNGAPSGRHPNSKGQNSSRVKPPFTNTEYTGSDSLTAKRNHEASKENKLNPKEVDVVEGKLIRSVELLNINDQDLDMRIDTSVDLRESLNRRALAKANQAQSKAHVPQQQQPKRYSAQRQRQQTDTNTTMPSVGMPTGAIPPSSTSPMTPMDSGIIPQPLPAAVTSTMPLNSGTVVPNQVAGFAPQSQPYFEGTNTAVNGPSVSPSIWPPHASGYAPAPYPSPPPQAPVPSQNFTEPAPFITPQGNPPIYGPAQYIQETGILRYGAQTAPFPAPAYHPQGYTSYAHVQPPGLPPEVYHAGVTYYSTQNQIPRAHVQQQHKRPKSNLQLMEPPEKNKSLELQPVEKAMDKYLADGMAPVHLSQDPSVMMNSDSENMTAVHLTNPNESVHDVKALESINQGDVIAAEETRNEPLSWSAEMAKEDEVSYAVETSPPKASDAEVNEPSSSDPVTKQEFKESIFNSVATESKEVKTSTSPHPTEAEGDTSKPAHEEPSQEHPVDSSSAKVSNVPVDLEQEKPDSSTSIKTPIPGESAEDQASSEQDVPK